MITGDKLKLLRQLGRLPARRTHTLFIPTIARHSLLVEHRGIWFHDNLPIRVDDTVIFITDSYEVKGEPRGTVLAVGRVTDLLHHSDVEAATLKAGALREVTRNVLKTGFKWVDETAEVLAGLELLRRCQGANPSNFSDVT